jgi:hypothetical protein
VPNYVSSGYGSFKIPGMLPTGSCNSTLNFSISLSPRGCGWLIVTTFLPCQGVTCSYLSNIQRMPNVPRPEFGAYRHQDRSIRRVAILKRMAIARQRSRGLWLIIWNLRQISSVAARQRTSRCFNCSRTCSHLTYLVAGWITITIIL